MQKKHEMLDCQRSNQRAAEIAPKHILEFYD
jgi:hypothetical protein